MPRNNPPFGEFVALIGVLMAVVAYSVDAMLPLLDPLTAELAPGAPQTAHLVITVFMGALGLGTLIVGPLSDALGRRRLLLAGLALYVLAAVGAALAQDMTQMLVARFVQGLGASVPRVLSQALVRDRYSGRMMARVLSFSMTVFVLIPAIAPFMGATLGAAFGWRAIFWSYLAFGATAALWLALRQPETLPVERRRPLTLAALWSALRDVLGHARVRLYLLALTFLFTIMLLWISSVAMIFARSFDRVDSFPAWFALAALVSAPSGLLNAQLVVRLGMARMVAMALAAQMVATGITLVAFGLDLPFAGFGLFMGLMLVQFFANGFLIGNLYALALEPMGHVAGMAASVMGGVSTIGAATVAGVLAAFNDGTPLPLVAAAMVCLVAAALSMRRARGLAE